MAANAMTMMVKIEMMTTINSDDADAHKDDGDKGETIKTTKIIKKVITTTMIKTIVMMTKVNCDDGNSNKYYGDNGVVR